MPTPNQTTPDSPERVPASHQRISNMLRLLATTPKLASLHEWSDFVNDIGGLMLAESETTRLAEALKEAREKLEAVTAWAESIEVVHAHPFLNNRCIVEARQFLAAPISGAKKE